MRLSWEQLWRDISSFTFENESDRIFWTLEKNKRFSVKSVYNAMTRSDAGSHHKMIWKGKVPTKIKIFMWLMANNAVLTKDNLIKRNGKEIPNAISVNVMRTYLISSFNVL